MYPQVSIFKVVQIILTFGNTKEKVDRVKIQ